MERATRDEAWRWIAEAEKDLKDAEMLLRYESYYPLCRLAYLASEKAMRGLLLAKGQHVPDQATLASLRQQVEAIEPALRSLVASLRPLERFEPLSPPAELHEGICPPPLYGRESAKEGLTLAKQAITGVKQSIINAT